MVKRAVFKCGDIVRMSLQPTQFRTALVLSPAEFNALGVVLVAPISQAGNVARYAGFASPLSGTETQGVALVNMLRAMDLEARGARLVETVPAEVVDDALARLHAIIT